MSERETDAITGTETTGHEWDGIKELNTPLPRWWLWTFYATVIWSVGYMIAYPAIPLITDATKGVLGYSSRAEVFEQIEAAKADQAEFLQRIETASLEEIRADSDLLFFAMAGGRSAYAVNCSQCHGSGAAGGPGYPNLNDDAWIWGGTPDAIYTTLKHGIRYDADDETRFSEMPAFGRDELLEREEIEQVAEYVLSLGGTEHDAALAAAGETLYVDNCEACHGTSGGGDPELGAPNISDAIWLYGSSREEIVAQIHNPSHGVMPGWTGRLDDATLKKLSLYVHGLGGGQ